MKNANFSQMLVPTIIMGAAALVLFIIAYLKGNGEHIDGLKSSGFMVLIILPLLIFALIIAGMVQVLIAPEVISKWIGSESGFKGIVIGWIAGIITPGGPFICFPIAAGFLKAGAGIGTIISYVCAWALLSIARLPLEMGILGWKFSLIRIVSTLFIPPLIGFIAEIVFARIKL